MEFTVLTRQEMFDLVWSVPMQKLGQRFGISDVALKKRCKKHAIPTPGLGYWARVAAGQKLKRPMLPKVAGSHLDRIVLKPALAARPPVPKDELPIISVPANLVEPHEATLWAKQRLKDASKDSYGRLSVGGLYHPDLCVRPETVGRALLIIDTVAKALAERGGEVVVAPYHEKAERVVLVQSGSDRLVLQIEERLVRKPHVATPAEEKAAARPFGLKPKKWDYAPEGRLSLRLTHTHYLFRGRARWTETKAASLEQQLGKIVVGIEAAIAAHKEARAEEVLRNTQRLADERARLRPERLRWYEAWMAKDLEGHVEAWARARQLRAFLDAYEASKRPVGSAADWLAAARGYADALDPLVNEAPVARDLQPTDELLERLITQERAREKSAR